MDRNVLTIATGKKIYADMAANLARSFFLWHPGTDIRFRIVTDNAALLPIDVLQKADIFLITPGEFGLGFSPKLHLDQLAPPGQTLFIDSDCLVFENLEYLFPMFKGKSVSVIGDYISSGEWFGDIGSICRKFSVPHLPKFNGGLYYLEKNAIARAVYETARELESEYDTIGFIRMRNRPADEILMAVAMQLHCQKPISDNGQVIGDLQACQGVYYIDVVRGSRLLTNPTQPSLLHQPWYPFEKVSPSIVHFLGYYTEHYPYRREVYRLKKLSGHHLSWFTNAMSLLAIEYPERLKKVFKNRFRSTYHKLFGFRKIKTSDRVDIL